MKCVFFVLCVLMGGMMAARGDVVVSVVRPGVDSVVVFKFKVKSNVFMPAMYGNNKSMEQLKVWTDRYRAELSEGKCHFSVEGFCKDFDDQAENRKIARERSLYVKGYLIKELQLKEKYFVTRNLPVESYYQADKGGVAEKKKMPAELTLEVSPEIIVVHDTIVREVVKEVVREVPVEVEPEVREIIREVKSPRIAERGFRLKTNLLGWLGLTPNIGAEYLFNEHWSVSGDVRWAGWELNDKRYRLALGGPEVRYYFGDESRLRGVFAGVFYTGGKFNLKFGETGYQGNLHSGGLTMGYALSVCRPLFLEFVLGTGFSHASYDTYVREQDEDVRTGNAVRNLWGVNKAQITLGWIIR